jgi:hypothetical protein
MLVISAFPGWSCAKLPTLLPMLLVTISGANSDCDLDNLEDGGCGKTSLFAFSPCPLELLGGRGVLPSTYGGRSSVVFVGLLTLLSDGG